MRNIPFLVPDMSLIEVESVKDTLLSGWITTGPKTKKFEEEMSKYFGTNRTVGLSSATAALEITLMLLGVGPGDEVIVPAYTYTASCSVICHVGATPIMIDCAKDSFEMDYNQLSDLITEKTKVIIPVDIGGVPCDYNRIYDIIDINKNKFIAKGKMQELFGRIIVLADCAHAFGSKYKGLMCGNVADFSCFSFHAVKNLTTAEGGAVTWKHNDKINDEELYDLYQFMSLHGQTKDALHKNNIGSWEYDIIYPAYKCNMTDIMAALGLAQLERYPELLKRRSEIIQLYNKGLENLPVSVLKHEGEKFWSNGHLYLVRINNIDVDKRNEIIFKMAEKGVACNVHYKPLPMMTAYKRLEFDIKDFPNAYAQYENEITFPLYTTLMNEDVEYVISCFKETLVECGCL